MKYKIKLFLGLLVLPIAYAIWVVDRLIYTFIPQSDHKRLNDWLNNQSITFAITRIITIVGLRYLFKWIFGY